MLRVSMVIHPTPITRPTLHQHTENSCARNVRKPTVRTKTFRRAGSKAPKPASERASGLRRFHDGTTNPPISRLTKRGRLATANAGERKHDAQCQQQQACAGIESVCWRVECQQRLARVVIKERREMLEPCRVLDDVSRTIEHIAEPQKQTSPSCCCRPAAEHLREEECEHTEEQCEQTQIEDCQHRSGQVYRRVSTRLTCHSSYHDQEGNQNEGRAQRGDFLEQHTHT